MPSKKRGGPHVWSDKNSLTVWAMEQLNSPKECWCMPEAVSLKWAVWSSLPSAETGTSLRTVALRPCFFYAFVQNHIVLIVGPLITTVTIVTGQINCVLWALIIACAMVVPDWCWVGSIKTSWYKRCRFWQEGREGKKLHSASGLCGGCFINEGKNHQQCYWLREPAVK